jgi:hypothetical protein
MKMSLEAAVRRRNMTEISLSRSVICGLIPPPRIDSNYHYALCLLWISIGSSFWHVSRSRHGSCGVMMKNYLRIGLMGFRNDIYCHG